MVFCVLATSEVLSVWMLTYDSGLYQFMSPGQQIKTGEAMKWCNNGLYSD